MNREFLIAVSVLSVCVGLTRAQSTSSEPTNPVVPGLVKVADHVKLPAKEPGVLIHLSVKEGSQVRAGQVLGKIDDREIQVQMKAADYKFKGAVQRYNDDVDIRYSDAAALVAKQDYEIMQEANKIREKAITEVDVRRAKLEWDKMDLASEKARKERILAKYEAYQAQAELEAAKLAIERRVITSPFDGVVEELSR
jgi:multidrug efflux pump subunit AcrA (membrane-fusion protein)